MPNHYRNRLETLNPASTMRSYPCGVAMMNRRWKITGVLAAVAVLCVFVLLRSDSNEQRAVEVARSALRQQGFKTDLSEFDFSASAEFRARTAALAFAGPHLRRPPTPEGNPELMMPVGSNAARVIWQQFKLASSYSGEDVWPALRESLNENRAEMDAACAAALFGTIRFDLNANAGNAMLLPHLASLKNLIQMLANRAVLELHDGNRSAAWTNLLAASRLVTAYNPEPAEVSHLVRYSCATAAFNIAWETLQAAGWTDVQLEQLQREWESVDFFSGLPETAAFKRASMVATCQLERQQPISRAGVALNDVIHSPRSA